MAKSKKPQVPALREDELESGGWSPQVPGIGEPFVIPEAGQEGARAAYELHAFVQGQIDDGSGRFRDYSGAHRISKDV